MQYDEHGNGWLLAAIVAVILWLAALVAALGVDVSAPAPCLRSGLLAGRRLRPGAAALGIVALQAGGVVLALVVFQASVAAMVPFALLSCWRRCGSR